MKYLRLFVTVGFTLILSQFAFPQPPSQKTKAPVKNVSSKEKSDGKLEAERIQKERQAQARSLLVSLASDARSFRDQTLRARSLARIADALWELDAEQGRTLFRKAWEAAEIAHREANERLNIRDGVVAIKPDEVSSTTLFSMVSNPDLRKEVLRLVAPHDRMLSEEFLEKLKESQSETKSEKPSTGLWDVPDAVRQRLNLAENLLRTGNIERALQLAEPALGNVTGATLDFLTLLRERDAAAADQRYAAMLVSTSNNMLADANTVSLLSSYIFTPNTYVIFNRDGAATGSFMPARAPANVSPQLRAAFFQTAAAILLRPQPPPDQDQSTTGVAGKYMVLKRLLPLFEQYAPSEMVAPMRSQFEALNSLVSDSVRDGETESVQKGITPDESFASQESSLLDQIEHARTSEDRDQLYFKLALLALKNEDLKARDYVSKIEDGEFRKQAQGWVDWGLAVSAVEKKKTELALELNRTGELTQIQRVWVLTQTAKLLAKTDREKASSLLDTASAEARRISGGDLDHPRALFAIANALRVVEPARVSEAILDAVKAANSTEGFVGEGGMITQTINSKNVISVSPQNVPDFDIAEVFGALANDDYDGAVQLARAFQGEAPRTNATIAIARSVLRPLLR
ncbi:MAG TPA: hypothetical protein VKB05_06850 [Pyrinomonadaceae bacterium]|nr:hypothetical protein [Pyrinomonadaceae bacterium]